jgi:N-formylglutamate deformylase
VQLELTQCSYMEESGDFAFRPDRAERIQPTLRRLLEAVLAYAHGAR